MEDGDLIDSVDLASLNPVPGPSFVNDVAVDNEGNAYVTTSDQGIIYKVDTDGEASIFFNDNRFTPSDPFTLTGFNGFKIKYVTYS